MSDKTSVPYEAIQEALYTRLKGHIDSTIYDEVPLDPVYPYTALGEPTDLPFEARSVKGRLVSWPIISYSRNAGGKFELYKIMASIVEHLTAGKLAMTGWAEVWKTYQSGPAVRLEKQPAPTWAGTVSLVICVVKNT